MGKGSKPRNCFSSEFRNNYQEINWRYQEKLKNTPTECSHCGCRSVLNEAGVCAVCEADILGD